MVPTVERGLFPVVFCSMAIMGLSPVMLSTSGFSRIPMNCFAYAESVSMYLLCPSAYMVSNARDDLPLPLSPVITTNRSRGMESDTPLRLCARAPLISIYSVLSLPIRHQCVIFPAFYLILLFWPAGACKRHAGSYFSSSLSSSSYGRLNGWRNGFLVLSSVMVVCGPCPGITLMSPSRVMSLLKIPSISLS